MVAVAVAAVVVEEELELMEAPICVLRKQLPTF